MNFINNLVSCLFKNVSKGYIENTRKLACAHLLINDPQIMTYWSDWS